MIQKGNFLLIEYTNFRDWLYKQKVTRTIKTLQVHHTWKPDYKTRKVVNGIGQQDKFLCLEGMRNTHLKNGWSATGQNITIFEDGWIGISLDRDLNQTPAGIKGANTNSICIEIIGNFDKEGDKITELHKKTISHVYASLCEKFNLIPSDVTLIYHCWYTSNGIRLDDYIKGKSAKTCPGTNFLGVGNTKEAFKKSLLPMVERELSLLKGDDKLELTNYEWNELKKNIELLLKEKVITSTDWITRVENRTITNSQLNWLNNVSLIRLMSKLPK